MLFWEHLLQFLLILTNYELHACFLIKTICPSQIVATYRGLTVAIDERQRETDSDGQPIPHLPEQRINIYSHMPLVVLKFV